MNGSMRRLAALFAAVLALTACSGEQGERAQALLTRAQVAQSKLQSATYEARMTFSVDGRRFAMVMNGGGYLKGRRAGDQRLSMHTDGVPGVGAVDMQLLVRGGRVSMTMNGRSYSVPAPAPTVARQSNWSTTMADLARVVKRVKVYENRVVNGERGATVAGVIDTDAILKTAAAKLSAFGAAPDLEDAAGKLGDIHAALFVSERTGLIRSAVFTMSMAAQGKKADVELTYRLDSTNTAVPGL
jgi:hypothetical protein